MMSSAVEGTLSTTTRATSTFDALLPRQEANTKTVRRVLTRTC
eukprot:Nitzschia sp. Nitz4//scaffold7_size249615//244066//244194//NITZ4_001221-RA/size249615-exonerate_protein2genome-gene-0.179-mRNA-1//1//CDS//3329558574//4588//frame0